MRCDTHRSRDRDHFCTLAFNRYPNINAPCESFTWGQKVTGGVIAPTFVRWVFPGVYFASRGPAADGIATALPLGTSVFIAALPLLMLPDSGRKQAVLPWEEYVQNFHCGIIALIGGGISMGKQMQRTGLTEVIASSVIRATGIDCIFALIFASIIVTIAFTQILENLAVIAVMSPMIFAPGFAINDDPHVVMIPVVAAPFAGTASYMTPIGSAPCAIAHGSGHISLKQMVFCERICAFVSIFVIFTTVIIGAPLVWPPA